MKFLECGFPITLGNTISFSDGIDKRNALMLIINTLENVAKTKGVNIILVRDFYANELSFYDKLLDWGFKRSNSLPNTKLKIRWDTFEEYLEDLKSHYRCKIRKNIRIAQEEGVIEEIIEDFSSLDSCLQILWGNVYNNAKEFRREILTKDFFVNIDKYLNDRTKVILLKKDSIIRGFGLVLSDIDTLKFMYVGLDYEFNRKYCIYLNLLYSVVKLAITEKKKEIDMGITSYFAKTDVGADKVNLYFYFKHLNPLLHPILAFTFRMLFPKIKSESKYIFKRQKENN